MPMEHAAQALIEFGRAAAAGGLLQSTCGNASLRLDAETLLISASGSTLACLSDRELSTVRISDGATLAGPKPSVETELHRRVYLVRPDAHAVLHGQSKAATLVACLADPPRSLDFIPEIPAYIRAFAYVPYALPGSEALASSVEAAFTEPEVTVVQMQNHGQVIVGATPAEVLRRGAFFELACSFATSSHALRAIPAEDAARLRDYGRR
jgi:L-fuculose-phosphate aldolase